jgi:hypothetical protein
MADPIVLEGIPIIPEGTPDIVNISEGRLCCFCRNLISKRKQMWKYPDGNYMCVFCKTHFDEENAKEVIYSTNNAMVGK